MSQLSQGRRTSIAPLSPVSPEVIQLEQEDQQARKERCRPLFERLHSTLIETHPNWFIAIDPDTEEYVLDQTIRGLTEKISQIYDGKTIRMIYQLNDTGTCGKI